MTRPLTILFVDSDVDFTDITADALRSDGHVVHFARDGTSAIAISSELEPDVVLLDLRLPDADGYDVVRALRQRIPRTTPIIVVTVMDQVHSDDIDLVVSKSVALELFGGLVEYVERCRAGGLSGNRTR